MKVCDNLLNKDVEKTAEQFRVAQKYYPDRFTKKKAKEKPLPKVETEKKED